MNSFENPSAMRALLSLFVLLGLGFGFLAYFFGLVVPPGYVGVRQINFGPFQGFSERGLRPGYHWSIPFYSQVHLVPQKIQILQLDREVGVHPDTLGALDIQTTDGSTVDVDLSILKSFYPDSGVDNGIKHGGPSELIRNVGTSKERWDNHLKRTAEDALRRSLGKLYASQFYNPDLREEKVKEAFDDMKPRVAEFGIKLEGLLVRRYTYRTERIDNAIFQKNLQAQEEGLNAAASKLAEAKAKLEQVAAEWDAKIMTLKVEGENKAKVIVSEANLYESQKRADGDLEVAKAQAEVERQKASALAQSEAARTYVAKEIAPLLASLKGGVVSDLDPYNLEAWMKKLGMQPK